MSNPSAMRVFLVFLICLVANAVFADSFQPSKSNRCNWQWSVVLIKEPLPDFDTLVRYRETSEQKTAKTVEKACKELKKELSDLAEVAFHNNPPFEGSVVLTLTLKRNVDWSLPIEGNRAAAVTDKLIEGRDTRDIDQAEPLPLTETRDNRHGKGKAKDLEIVAARLELFDLDSTLIASHECPKNDKGRPEIRELARMVAPDMVRFAARNREMTTPAADTTRRH